MISNYVYHNITNAPDKHALLRESLRVLKKGGVFALQDDMKPGMYGDTLMASSPVWSFPLVIIAGIAMAVIIANVTAHLFHLEKS